MLSQYQSRISQALAQIQDRLEQGAHPQHDPSPNDGPNVAADQSAEVAQLEQTLSTLQSENAELRDTIARLTQERAQEAQELEALYTKLADALNDTPQQEDE